jgi:hypothetical protein
MMRHHQDMPMEGYAGMRRALTPAIPGQDAFGAIQEVVHILDADPKTDWSKVALEPLRQHLIDMNEVTLKADADANTVDGGLEVTITGTGPTLVAIQRMIPAYAQNVKWPRRLDRQHRAPAERRTPDGQQRRPEGNPAFSRPWLYWSPRQRFDASAAPSGHGQRRI